MLVLTRKVNEKIVLKVPPSDVEQTIVIMLCRLVDERGALAKHDAQKARIGIEAPLPVVIYREELDCESREGI